MASPLSPDLIRFGATYTPATPPAGSEYWKLVSAAGPDFSTGNVVVFVDVLDASGARMTAVPVQFYWADGDVVQPTEAKPDDARQAVSFVLSAAGNSYGVRVADGRPSDSVFGLGLVAGQPHASYFLVFQLATAQVEPVPPVAPDKPFTARELIGYIEFYLTKLKEALP